MLIFIHSLTWISGPATQVKDWKGQHRDVILNQVIFFFFLISLLQKENGTKHKVHLSDGGSSRAQPKHADPWLYNRWRPQTVANFYGLFLDLGRTSAGWKVRGQGSDVRCRKAEPWKYSHEDHCRRTLSLWSHYHWNTRHQSVNEIVLLKENQSCIFTAAIRPITWFSWFQIQPLSLQISMQVWQRSRFHRPPRY